MMDKAMNERAALKIMQASTCFGKDVCQSAPCACAAAIAAADRVAGLPGNNDHYLRAIKHKLKMLYDLSEDNPRYREQISDEMDWIDAALALSPGKVSEEL